MLVSGALSCKSKNGALSCKSKYIECTKVPVFNNPHKVCTVPSAASLSSNNLPHKSCFYMKELHSLACIILDQQILCNFKHNNVLEVIFYLCACSAC